MNSATLEEWRAEAIRISDLNNNLRGALEGLVRNCLLPEDYQPRRSYVLSTSGRSIIDALDALKEYESTPSDRTATP